MEGDNQVVFCALGICHFNPLPPHGGRLLRGRRGYWLIRISIHSLRMEGDNQVVFCALGICHFNPLPPHGGRPHMRRTDQNGPPYFNPLPPHGGRHIWIYRMLRIQNISIHSLRMEGDDCCFMAEMPLGISIHSLRMEGDTVTVSSPSAQNPFQSTPSAWRETWIVQNSPVPEIHFNPLPPHGGRRKMTAFCCCINVISIHSLRMEGDSKTAQESVFHFAYPCTILQKRMQKTTFCTRKNGFFRKKGEKFGAKPSASFCAPMIRTDTFPLNFSHRISGSSMSMVSFAPICSTFD